MGKLREMAGFEPVRPENSARTVNPDLSDNRQFAARRRMMQARQLACIIAAQSCPLSFAPLP